MFKPCDRFKCENCAVCANINKRDIFKSILKECYPDTYICEYAQYEITNSKGEKFILPSLDLVVKGKNGYYVRDKFTPMIIYLNKDNFEVICPLEERCSISLYVSEYVMKHKKAAK